MRLVAPLGRIILRGGVDVENKRAIGFYKSVGFFHVVEFENLEARICLDMYQDVFTIPDHQAHAADAEGNICPAMKVFIGAAQTQGR